MADIPRRVQLDKLTEAELAIRRAVLEVEKLAADERLTDAVILLGAARDSVADYVDGVMRRRYVDVGKEPEPDWNAAMAAGASGTL